MRRSDLPDGHFHLTAAGAGGTHIYVDDLETHRMATLRYIADNPVRANLCPQAADWPWSFAAAA